MQLAIELDMSGQRAFEIGRVDFPVPHDLVREAVGYRVRYLERRDLARRELLLAQHGRLQRRPGIRELELRSV